MQTSIPVYFYSAVFLRKFDKHLTKNTYFDNFIYIGGKSKNMNLVCVLIIAKIDV